MTRTSRAGGAAALLALTVIAYLPAFRTGFIWDDDAYVTENETLRSLGGLGRIWTEPGVVPQYYPLVHTTFWIEYHLWGLHPLGYHVVNVLLHAVNAVLVWAVLRRFALRWAWFAAAVFALHPVHAESVVWITERKNTLSTLLYLLSALAYLRFRPLERSAPAASGGSRLFYVAALAAYLGALLSKTVTCSLPAALLLVTWWKRGRLGWRDVRPLLPFFVLGIGLALVTIRMERHRVGAVGPEWDLSFLQRTLIAGRALWLYAFKLLWPADLAFIYKRWLIDAGVWWQYRYPAAALAAVLILWLARRWLGRGPLTAVLFFGGTLFPALGFFNVYPMRYSFVADHFQYLASLGLIALAVSAAATLFTRWHFAGRRVALIPALGVLAALGASTWRQALIYQDPETLWRDTVVKNPTAFIALNNLALTLKNLDRTADAVPYFERALAVRPGDPAIVINLANAYGKTGRLADALRMYSLALQHDPGNAAIEYNIGVTYALSQQYDQAREHLTRALEAEPRSDQIRAALARVIFTQANLLAQQDKLPEAAALYRECLKLVPGMPEALSALSRLPSSQAAASAPAPP